MVMEPMLPTNTQDHSKCFLSPTDERARHEKTCFLQCENKGADQMRGNHSAD